jgi:hypothetical protein
MVEKTAITKALFHPKFVDQCKPHWEIDTNLRE